MSCSCGTNSSAWLGIVVIVASIAAVAEARDTPRGDGPANAASREVYEETMRILASVQSTKYEHKTQIDEKKGQYLCDCSGFVGYVLNQTVAKESGKGPFGDGKKRPLAMDYANFFAAAPTKEPSPYPLPKGEGNKGADGWQQVTRLADARPGDVIAWKREKPVPGNTGHVVIVGERPVLEPDGLVRVLIIDSTTLPSSDITADKGKSGVGRRTMWFTIDNEGRPTGTIRGSRKSKPKIEPVSIGRALPSKSAKTASRRAA